MLLTNNKISIKKRLTASIVVFLSIVALLIGLLTIPAVNDIKKLRNEILNKKIELEETLVKEKNMSKLNEKIKIIEPKLEEFNNVYINENKELEFITTLEGVALKNNVKQTINLVTDSASDENGHKKIPLNLSVIGRFTSIMEYLTELEALNYYISIENFEISSENNSVDDGLLKISDEESSLKNDRVLLSISAFSYWK